MSDPANNIVLRPLTFSDCQRQKENIEFDVGIAIKKNLNTCIYIINDAS